MAKLKAESEGKEKARMSLSNSFALMQYWFSFRRDFSTVLLMLSGPSLGAAVPDGTVRTDQKQEDESHSYPSDFSGELVSPLQSACRKELIHSNSLPAF